MEGGHFALNYKLFKGFYLSQQLLSQHSVYLKISLNIFLLPNKIIRLNCDDFQCAALSLPNFSFMYFFSLKSIWKMLRNLIILFNFAKECTQRKKNWHFQTVNLKSLGFDFVAVNMFNKFPVEAQYTNNAIFVPFKIMDH